MVQSNEPDDAATAVGSSDAENSLLKDNDEVLDVQLTRDNECGFLCFHQACLQRLASKKAYIVIHGLSGTIMASIYSFFNGIVTTLEKRFKIPTRNIGLIITGFEIAASIAGPILTHYLRYGHRPKWVSFTIITAAAYCFLLSALHLMYGAGKNALDLTVEFGAAYNPNSTTHEEDLSDLCQLNATLKAKCEVESGDLFPQIYLFSIHFFSGIFGFLYDSLGTSYMDDNIQKAKAPVYLSISFFIRLLGPSIGYGLASLSVSHYIAPQLTPTITQTDPRWMGAWWMGSIVNGVLLTIIAFLVAFFPKELPRAAVRRQISQLSDKSKGNFTELTNENRLNFIDGVLQILKNKVLVLNILSSVFLFLGLLPYWTYAPKYLESQYRQTAAQASFLTGSVAIVFTALGTLSSGYLIQKFKPSARQLCGWNIFVGLCTICTVISYIYIGCPSNDNAVMVNNLAGNLTNPLSFDCHCEYSKFSPICGENGHTYVSACHAGCTDQQYLENGTIIYENCYKIKLTDSEHVSSKAISGFCPVNCDKELLYFMIILCINQFLTASTHSTKLLITMRSVAQHNKSFALAISYTVTSLLAFTPAAILYGWIFDQSCVFWGKTCTGTGNCWLYDNKMLRKYFNLTAASALFIATILETNLCRAVKNVKLFDKNEEEISDKMKDMKFTITIDNENKSFEMKNIIGNIK